MALAANALTTYETVRDELNLADGDRRSKVERAINAASAAIAEFCNRDFARGTVTEAHPARGGLRLVVKRRPVLSLVSWSEDGEARELADLEIEDAEAGILLARAGLPCEALAGFGLSLDPLAGSEPPSVRVVYVGGYVLPGGTGDAPTLPATVEEACIITAVSLFANSGQDRRITSESLDDYSVTFGGVNTAIGRGAAGIIPDEAAVMLGAYRLLESA